MGLIRLFLESSQQINWWLQSIFKIKIINSKIHSKRLLFIASFLNSFRISEIKLWQSYGIKNWHELSQKYQ